MKRHLQQIVILLCSFFTFGIGGTVCVGYMTGHPEWSAWTHHALMASPTALGFVFTGTALILLALRK